MGWSKEARGQGWVDGSAAARRTKVCPCASCLCLLISDLTLPPFSQDKGAHTGRTQNHRCGQPKDTVCRGNAVNLPWQCSLGLKMRLLGEKGTTFHVLSFWGQLTFFSIFIFMPNLACNQKVWVRASYFPKMSL